MPIRMEEDPQEPRREPRRPVNPGGGGSGGGGLMQMLPYALMFLFKKPKLLVPVLIGAGVLYFLGFFDSCMGGGQIADNYGPSDNSGIVSNNEEFSFGATLSEKEFDKAQVFEPLQKVGYGATRLPRRVSLEQYAPSRMQQGTQGSCVGWASSYAARTILQSRATGAQPNQVAFSPSFLYNNIKLNTNCQGAYMHTAMAFLKENGTLPFKEFAYDERTCSVMPDRAEASRAKNYRTKGYNRLTYGAGNYKIDMDGMKQNLAQGAPVVIGMMVGGTFMQNMRGQKLWRPTRRDYSQQGYGGHAMCVIGYDEDLEGGSFQIMNSWGNEWGQNGLGWVTYKDFAEFTKEAYGLHPMGSAENLDPNRLSVKFGLVDNKTQKLIPLRQLSDQLYGTKSKVQVGQKFKVAVTNSNECYVYVFGEETDGSAYTLFPYTEKHSPYCGIVGTRVFPRDHSMKADDLGTRDRIAVVVSKEELPYQDLQKGLNISTASTFDGKLNQILGEQRVKNVKFNATADGAVEFDAQLREGEYFVGWVIEIEK